MDNLFSFKAVLPVKCSIPDLDQTLNELKILIDAEEINISPVPLSCNYYSIADFSSLPSIINYFSKSELSLLCGLTEGSEELAYSCLEFTCCFSISDHFIESNISNLSDDESECIWEVSYFDQTGKDIVVRFGATEIFTDILYSYIRTLVSLLNISNPGCFKTNIIFIDRYYSGKSLQSPAPDIKVFQVPDLTNYINNRTNYNLNIFSSKINAITTIPIKTVWDWYLTQRLANENTSISRALNRYFLIMNCENLIDVLILGVSALEALFVRPYTNQPKTMREPSKQNQLISNINISLNKQELLSNTDLEVLIKFVYDQRSRIVHGDKALMNPFRKSFNDDMLIEKASYQSLSLLLLSLRHAVSANS